MAILKESLPKVSPPECTFPDSFEKYEPIIFKAKRLNIKYSSHKLAAAAMLIRGKHLFDALILINNSLKKGGNIVKKLLESASKNGIKKGYQEERFFVKEVVIGRRMGTKRLEIKARGKTGIR